MKPTVHDIARSAGVSLATVDRVLNDRPGVRIKTREREIAAMNALGHDRDVGAANLARGRRYRFDFILPDNDNSFMLALRAELEAALKHAAADRILINLVLVPAFDEAALVTALDASIERRPDGVAFVAVDTDPVRAACERLTQNGIHAVTLVPTSAAQPANIMSAWTIMLPGALRLVCWGFLPKEPKVQLPFSRGL